MDRFLPADPLEHPKQLPGISQTVELCKHGSLSSGIGWQIPRLPGLGDVDWSRVFSALYRVGYDGPIIIEHEDADFEETDELIKDGFLLARNVLAPYVV